MKTAMWMLAALAACIASNVNADGVCYDPDHGTGKNEASVRADLAAIKAKGFSHVRTYISSLGGLDMAAIVANSGLRSALGVPYPDGDYNTHITYATEASKKYGTVDYIFVGNENLADKGSVPQTMFDAIADVRRKAPGVKVGTVQRTAEFVKQPARFAELVQACDFVGVNIHPWFTGGLNGNNAIEQTKSQWNAAINSGIPGIGGKLILGETGWPSGPSDGGYAGNKGTPDSAKAYYAAYKSWSSFLSDSKKFYFQYFDTPYKGGGYESFFGIVTYDNKDKFGAGGNPAPAPTPAPTPVPTTPAPTTPAPTTPAPTTPAPTTVEPALNGTSSSGSSSVDAETLLKSSSGSAETGVTGSAASDSTTESTAENEAGVLDGTSTGTKTTGTSTDSTDATGTDSTGGNTDGGSTEANVKGAAEGGSIAGVLVVAAFGVAAVGAAFAFIWKARQKALELDETENKSFDSRLSMTPGGACAL